MSELPTREEARKNPNKASIAFRLLDAYAEGRLIDGESVDYAAAEPAMREFVGWVYSGGSVGPKEYDRIVKAYLKRIVDAALRVEADAPAGVGGHTFNRREGLGWSDYLEWVRREGDR